MLGTILLINLAGAVALLLWGTHMVSSGVLRGFGTVLRNWLGRHLGNRWLALLAGLGITGLLQSSTATSLMAASFTASGTLGLAPALAVMLGANVGTTLVVQLLSFDTSLLAPLALLSGLLLFRLGDGPRLESLGQCLIGLGLMLLALALLGHSLQQIEASPAFVAVIHGLEGDPLIALLLAALLTWACHSSVAVVLLVASLAQAGLVSLPIALALVLGANLGGALPALGVAGSRVARRLPLGNLLVRLLGCLLVLPWLTALAQPANALGGAAAVWFHSAFNLALALALVLAMRGFWLGLHGAEGIRRREGWLMFLGLGLGLLAKGPLTLILAGLPIGLWTLLEWRWRALWRGLPWIRGSLLMLLVAAPWYLLAELKTPGFLEYFLLGEHWQRFVTAGWDGDRYGNAHAYPYGSVWLFLLAAAFPWSLWLPLLLWLGWRQRGEVVDGVASRRRYWLFWGLAPCLFFTFAGNVLWTYVLPGLPALALLAADLLRAPLARSAWLRRGGLACLALTPLLFALFLGSLLLGSRAEQKSTAALLASDAGWRERPLVFWPKRPYSAVFYSGGRAQRAEDSELAGWLRRDALLAIRSRSFGALPDEVRQRLRCRPPVGQYQLCQGVAPPG